MSALDARMRLIAEQVLADSHGAPATASSETDRMAELEKQVADLTARVDELEKAPRRAATAKRTSV